MLLSLPILASAALGSLEPEAATFVDQHCLSCHGGDKVKGKIDFTAEGAAEDHELWELAAEVVKYGEMPPEEEPQPTPAEKDTFHEWYHQRFVEKVESRPGLFRARRLSASEYRNTLKSVLGFDLEVQIMEAEQTVSERSLVMKLLPTDPPGASGFTNDTHGAPLSSVLWEQYHYLAERGIRQLFSKARRAELGSLLGGSLSSDFALRDLSAAQCVDLLLAFADRAYRRPTDETLLKKSIQTLRKAPAGSRITTLRGEMLAVLLSPPFLYRGMLMERHPGESAPVDGHELAERLSYFLWEDLPDEALRQLAAEGTLSEPGVIRAQVDRMLQSPRSVTLSESFASQWLLLDEIDAAADDPTYRSALRSQPLDFLRYLFTEDRPLMELIDSKVTFANYLTANFYPEDRKQLEKFVKQKGLERVARPNQRIELAQPQGRGGLLTMPGILAMNHGPIIRGTWMLRRILGEHLGEPPPDVPPIQASFGGRKLSFRQQFKLHRSDAACARCHDKIDPLGFALEAYDDTGAYLLATNYRSQNRRGKPVDPSQVDSSGRLPGGERFADFEELKQLLLTTRRPDIIRNIVEQTLSYALCRRLEPEDRQTVDEITQRLDESNGTWRDLFHEVALSLPFRQSFFPSDS